MHKFRKLLVGVFSFVASLEILISIVAIPALVGLIKGSLGNQSIFDPYGPAARLSESVLLTACALLFAMPPVAGLLYGMAWWKLRRGRPSGRGWAIAASVAILAQGLPYYLVTFILLVYAESGAWRDFAVLDLATILLAALGMVAFVPRSAGTPVVTLPPRIAGDGTSNVLDVLVAVLSLAGYWMGWHWLERWGYAHGFESAHGLLVWEQLLGAFLINTAMHEFGHASTAIALGMRLRAFIVGPFQFRHHAGKWRFKFAPSKILGGGGAVGAVPTDANQPIWREVLMIAAGPLASLLTGMVALSAALTAAHQPYEAYWEFLGITGLLGILSFFVNLIPMRPEALYSDGARIYQLLSGGRWARLHRVETFVQATLVTPLRPRDYDMQAIERAAVEFTQGAQAVWLRLLATSHYIDRGEMARAREANSQAESIFQASQPDLHPAFCASLTFEAAFLRRDSAAARHWFERMTAKKSILSEFPTDYWLAQAALQWVENRPDEARSSLQKADESSQTSPTTGAYNYDRYLCTLLRQAMEKQPLDESIAVPTAE
jgi:Peptidase family M50